MVLRRWWWSLNKPWVNHSSSWSCLHLSPTVTVLPDPSDSNNKEREKVMNKMAERAEALAAQAGNCSLPVWAVQGRITRGNYVYYDAFHLVWLKAHAGASSGCWRSTPWNKQPADCSLWLEGEVTLKRERWLQSPWAETLGRTEAALIVHLASLGCIATMWPIYHDNNVHVCTAKACEGVAVCF